MLIKYASENDKQNIKDIWSICFPEDHDPFLSWFFDNVYKPENTLAAYDNDILTSNLQLLPYRINFHEAPLKVRYLVGAATLPEFRNRGIMAGLLRKAVEEAMNDGCPLILLLPFNYAFYRKFGWEQCYSLLKYKTALSNILALKDSEGSMEPVADPVNIHQLNSIYTHYHSRRNGWILRSPENWQNIIQDHFFDNGQISLYKDKNGVVSGYVFYKLQNNTLYISEAAFSGMNAASALWNFIGGYAGKVGFLEFTTPSDDISFFYLQDPRNTCSLEPFIMARVTDVRKILQLLARKYESDQTFKADTALYLSVDDPLAPWNKGIFSISKSKDSKANVTKMSNSMNPASTVNMSINTFTRLSMGIQSVADAKNSGLLNIPDENCDRLLNLFFKKTVNFMNELF